MKIKDKTKGQFLDELAKMRQQIAEMQASERKLKQAEDELKNSEERLRILFECAPGAYYLSDLKGNFIDGNRAAEEMIGYKREELIGKNFLKLKLLPPEQIAKAAANLSKNVQGKPTGPDEFTLIRKDGNQVIVEIRTFPVKIKNQTVVLGIARDITERKRAEEALRESEEKYKSLADQSLVGIFILQDGKIVYANKGLSDITEYSVNGILNWGFEEFVKIVHPEDRSFVIEQGRKKQIGKEDVVLYYSYRMITKSGSIKLVEIYSKTMLYGGRLAVQGVMIDVTERKRAEEALRKSEERYRALFENSQLGIYITTPEGRFKAVNQALARIDGYESPEELMAADIEKDIYVSSEDMRKLRDELKRKGYINNYEINYRRKNGKIITCLESAVAIRDEKGKVIEYQGSITDISERKKLQEALQKSEDRYRHFVENSPNPIFSIDEKGIIKSWNQACEKVFQYSKDIIEKEYQMLLPIADDRHTIESMLAQVFQGHSLSDVDISYRCKDGKVLFMASRIYPLPNEEERVKECVFANTDITERKKAEDALKESEEKFRSLAEQLPNMIFINKKDRVVYANKRCEDVMGYKRDELYSPDFDFLSLIAPESIELVKSGFGKHIKGEEVKPYEYTLITKDGKRIDAILTTKLIKYEDDKAILGIITDISQRKKMEEDNIRLNEELNKRNRQLRTANVRLMELSIKDGLTKIYNYRFFQEILVLNFNRARRSNQTLSCIMFDIDDFKQINDLYGHRAGDFILAELASLIKNNIRESDIFARYGGEEFVFLLPDNDLKSSVKIAEKVRILVESHDFIWKEKVLKITLSFGVSSTESEGIKTKESLLDVADNNLIKAKNKGKNCVYA